ncbi:MAG: GDSL-type esterase/lipase family protein [Enterococcus malodoratus]
MSWTTIWSHAQRGIARYSSSKGTVQLTMRRINSVEKIRLVFANEYGKQTQQIQNLTIKTNENQQTISDFSIVSSEIFTTPSILIDPTAKKWHISFQVSSIESGFSYNDADFFPEARTLDFCSGLIAIEAEVAGECVIALGDSLTEGATWTAPLQRTLRKQKIYLVNQGINGSCLLKASSDVSTNESRNFFYGFDSLKRLEFCLTSHSNVSKVILFLGVNDLINDGLTLESFQKMIQKLIELCKRHDITYQLCTLTPCLGYPGMNQAKEALRKEINHWLTENYDDLWDFSAIVEEEAGRLNPSFDSEDHLHFNAAGGMAIARRISSDFVKGE